MKPVFLFDIVERVPAEQVALPESIFLTIISIILVGAIAIKIVFDR